MHIFPYSRRSGTVADRLPDQLPNAVKEARCHAAAEVARKMEARYLDSWIGETQVEGRWHGHAPNYAEVFWSAPPEEQEQDLHNTVKSVHITGRSGRALEGVIL